MKKLSPAQKRAVLAIAKASTSYRFETSCSAMDNVVHVRGIPSLASSPLGCLIEMGAVKHIRITQDWPHASSLYRLTIEAIRVVMIDRKH